MNTRLCIHHSMELLRIRRSSTSCRMLSLLARPLSLQRMFLSPLGQANVYRRSIRREANEVIRRARVKLNIPTWRYRYFGVFPNLDPLPWLGAYHASEIPLVFGTSALSGANTEAEIELSKYMQTAWAAFARDPEKGLENYGWPEYQVDGKTLVILGKNNATTAAFDFAEQYDKVCA